MFAESLGIDISYEALHVEPVDFEESVRSLFQKGYTGLNVTLPLKQLQVNLQITKVRNQDYVDPQIHCGNRGRLFMQTALMEEVL